MPLSFNYGHSVDGTRACVCEPVQCEAMGSIGASARAENNTQGKMLGLNSRAQFIVSFIGLRHLCPLYHTFVCYFELEILV